jgi:predicted Zn-dependent protease
MNQPRIGLTCAALGLGLVTGCLDQQPWLVPQTPAAPAPFVKPPAEANSGGSVQQVSGRYTSPQQARLNEVGKKLLDGNKALALKPKLEVLATANLEIKHRGEHQLQISEGLVNACETDGQLAALLAVEMGRMVAERQARQTEATAEDDRLPPLEVPIGPDGGGFGAQARQAELAKLGFNKRKTETPPPPEAEQLGQQILTRGGFAATELTAAAALRQTATPGKR